MPNPWDNDPIAQPAQSAPAYPGVIKGAPDPYKAEDQQMQREAAERARRDQEMQERRFRADQEQREKDRQAGVNNAARESENKAAAFLLRALGANDGYEAQEIGARSLVGQKIADVAPNALNSLPETIGNSPRRQVADSTQDEFIAASLRQDSGAAIPEEEMERQRRIYFPMPGDSDDVIKAKRQARQRAIEGLKQSAGRLAEQTIATFQGMPKAEQAREAEGLFGSVTDDSPAIGGTGGNGGGDGGGPDDGIRISDVRKLSAMDGDQSGLSGLGTLAKQGITLGLADEAAGLGGAIASLLQGNVAGAGKAYETNRDAARLTVSRAREAHPYMGPVAEFVGGAAGAVPKAAVNSLGSVVRQGGALGGAAGFGYGEGGDSVPNALLGAATGAGLGAGLYGAAKGVNALAGRSGSIDADVVAAGRRQNIPVRQPDARPEMRGRYAAAESGQTSGPLIREARAGDAAAMEGRVAEVGGTGNPSDPYALGSKVQEAGKRYIARTREQADRLYRRAEEAAGDASVVARNADAVLDANIQELRAAGENSNAAAIKYLEGLRNDIDRGLSLKSVQNLRTNMRGQISQQGLTGTDTERRVGQVIDAMTQDLAEQLPGEAAQALKAADGFYRERQTFINDTLKQFLGSRGNPLSAETAATRLVSMTQGKGNFERFSRMWGQLDDAERADVSATVAASLGRARNGDFSPAMLVRSLDPRQGINPRTAALIFGRDGAQALQDLRLLAKAKTEAMNRQSPSGQAISGAAGGFKTMLMSVLGFASGGPAGAVAGGMGREFLAKWGEQRAARMLLNPDFTRWLKNAPETARPQVIDRYFARLGTIGSIAANDNAAFLGAMRRAFGGPGAAAAQDEQEAVGVPPQ